MNKLAYPYEERLNEDIPHILGKIYFVGRKVEHKSGTILPRVTERLYSGREYYKPGTVRPKCRRLLHGLLATDSVRHIIPGFPPWVEGWKVRSQVHRLVLMLKNKGFSQRLYGVLRPVLWVSS